MKKRITILVLAVLIISMCFGCSKKTPEAPNAPNPMQNNESDFSLALLSASLDRENIFTKRDISASYDEKTYNITLSDNKSTCDNPKAKIKNNVITITDTGTYVIKGTLPQGQIIVDADDTDKIQLVLNGVEIKNTSSAAINIVKAKKVFVTLAEKSTNTLSTTNEFVKTENNKADGVIYSKKDLTLNGSGKLTINSPYGHGVVCNDDLVIAGGDYNITAGKHCIKANDSINIADGKLNLNAKKDALHCDNDDSSKGNIYIKNVAFSINADDDAIQAGGYFIIDDGNITISNSHEGIEAQKIEINGGNISLKASDDGLNASGSDSSSEKNDNNKMDKSNPFDSDENCYINIAGGTLVVDADGDGIDSNGYLQQTGGDVTVYGAESGGNAALDYGISAKITGGKIIAFGYSSMAQGFGSNSTQGSITVSFDNETTEEFTLTDSNNNKIITAKTSKKYNCVTVSSTEIQKGETYTASAGSQSKDIEMSDISYIDSKSFGNGGGFNGNKPDKNDQMPDNNKKPDMENMPEDGKMPEMKEPPQAR